MTETKNNKTDADEYNIKEDGLRLLTTGEIQLEKFVFYPLLFTQKFGSTEAAICHLIFRMKVPQ